MLGLTEAQHTLEQKLRSAASEIRNGLSDYGKRYWDRNFPSLTYQLELSAHLLEQVIPDESDKVNTVLLDFGAGLGFTSLLAKEFGVGTVYYLDLYKPVCEDANTISEIVGLKADNYISKSFSESLDEISRTTAMVSRDVIEHIYDLEGFFTETTRLGGLKVMAHNTSANIYNVLLKSYFKEIHFKAENQRIRSSNDVKRGESECGFYHRRFEYISSQNPEFSDEVVETLAQRTRGMILVDIDKAVEHFRATEEYPSKPAHPTNTCDPDTGNWAERLLEFSEYESAASGYDLNFVPGFYNVHHDNKLKSSALRYANRLIRKRRLKPNLWPSFTIVCTPTSLR